MLERTVIIVLGPVGYGKSTFAHQLADASEHLEYKLEHIDGDLLGLVDNNAQAVVAGLKEKRNPITCMMIISAIMRGKVPVVSTGGGALWYHPAGVKSSQSYLQDLLKQHGIRLRVKVLVPGKGFASVAKNDKEFKTHLDSEYGDESAVVRTVRQRSEDGVQGWKPDSIERVKNISLRNKDLCLKWSRKAAELYTYPRSYDHTTLNTFDFKQAASTLGLGVSHSVCMTIKSRAFQQLYTADAQGITGLPENKLWHRTLFYSQELVEMSVPWGDVPFGERLSAVFVRIENEKSEFLCSFIKLPFDEEAHLTVDKGRFEAKEMAGFSKAFAADKVYAGIKLKAVRQGVTVTAQQVIALADP